MQTVSFPSSVRGNRSYGASGLISSRDGHSISEGEVLRFAPSFQSRTLQCSQGLLWVTVEGQVEDIVLKAKQRLQLPVGKLALVTALKSSVLGFDSRGKSSLISDWARQWFFYLRGGIVNG